MKLAVILLLLLTSNPISAENYQPRHDQQNVQVIATTAHLPGKKSRNLEPFKHKGINLPTREEFLTEVKICAKRHKVDPAILIAVAHIESRKLGKGDKVLKEFRFGWVGHGRWVAPMNLCKDYARKHPEVIYDWKKNLDKGASLLSGLSLANIPKWRKRMKGYNHEFTNSYFYVLVKAARQYRAEGVKN